MNTVPGLEDIHATPHSALDAALGAAHYWHQKHIALAKKRWGAMRWCVGLGIVIGFIASELCHAFS